jgi:hypothetical protein
MKVEKYTGYNVTLYTSLSIEECQRRLRADFAPSQPRFPRETNSDGNLTGSLQGRTFTIELWKLRLPVVNGLNRNRLGRERVFRGRLLPHAGGTRIVGGYGYGVNALLLDWFRLGIAVLLGVVFLVGGIGEIVGGRGTGWLLAPIGLLVLIVYAIFLFTSDDRQFLGERDYIVAYLERMLEAGRSGGVSNQMHTDEKGREGKTNRPPL